MWRWGWRMFLAGLLLGLVVETLSVVLFVWLLMRRDRKQVEQEYWERRREER